MKKVYFWKLKITQFGKIVQVRTRVFSTISLAVEALTDLNFIFHETLIKAELNILEEKE
jgi:hypothetical protein